MENKEIAKVPSVACNKKYQLLNSLQGRRSFFGISDFIAFSFYVDNHAASD
jgi:hypothetical protein